jgi:hypothetical protein
MLYDSLHRCFVTPEIHCGALALVVTRTSKDVRGSINSDQLVYSVKIRKSNEAHGPIARFFLSVLLYD